MSKKFILILLTLLILPLSASAQDIYFFRGEGCPHCANMEEFLSGLQQEYPQLKIHDYEIWYNEENRQLAEQMAQEHGTAISGVPTLFIGNEVIVGNQQEEVRLAVEKLIAAEEAASGGESQGEKAQAAAINTYGAWALVALVAVGLIWAVVSFRKHKYATGTTEGELPESRQ